MKPVSWNTLARKSHWKYTEVFDEWKQATWDACKEFEVGKYKGPVDLIFTASFNDNRKHDADNILVKPVIDQLVFDGVIERDDMDIVKSVTLKVMRGVTTCLVVEIKAAS